MKNNLKNYLRKDIDLNFFFLILWKNKILTILSILLSFLLIFSFYDFQKKDNKSTIIAKVRIDVPYHVILKIKSYNPNHDIEVYSQSALSLKIISYANFINFLHKDNKNDMEKILKKYNLYLNDYFFKYFSEIKDVRAAQYSLVAPIEIDGASFLNNYITFSKDQLVDEIYNDLKFYINNEINKNLNALLIAKELNIESPSKEPNQRAEEFNRGQKVLSIMISQLQSAEKLLSKESLDWDPFLVKAFQPQKLTKNYYFRTLTLTIIVSVVLGFLLALLIIFFKNNIKKN
jgi:hypothetical protein